MPYDRKEMVNYLHMTRRARADLAVQLRGRARRFRPAKGGPPPSYFIIAISKIAKLYQHYLSIALWQLCCTALSPITLHLDICSILRWRDRRKWLATSLLAARLLWHCTAHQCSRIRASTGGPSKDAILRTREYIEWSISKDRWVLITSIQDEALHIMVLILKVDTAWRILGAQIHWSPKWLTRS